MTSTRSPSPSAVSPRRLRATNCPFTAVATLVPWKPSSSSTRSSRATATSRDLPFKTMRIALLHTCRCAERQVCRPPRHRRRQQERSEEHTSELQSLMRISYAVFCLKKKNKKKNAQRSNVHKFKHSHQTRQSSKNHKKSHSTIVQL